MAKAILVERDLKFREAELDLRLATYREPRRPTLDWTDPTQPSFQFATYTALFTRRDGRAIYGADGLEHKQAYQETCYVPIGDMRAHALLEMRTMCEGLAVEAFAGHVLVDEVVLEQDEPSDVTQGLKRIQIRRDYVGRLVHVGA